MTQDNKITYATLSADNEALQTAYDKAIARVREEWLGVEVPMFINGEDTYCPDKMASTSPVDKALTLCQGQKGGAAHAREAITAARKAFGAWHQTPWQDRVAILRKIAEQIRANRLELSALIILEVGKNRLEALGEVEETADLLLYYADSMEKNNGFVVEMGKMNPDDPKEHNFSVLRPHGVWGVIAPFNFPMALSAAPVAAALVTGNTVVYKGASDTLYTNWKTAELFKAAGLPPGVFNYVSGPGSTVGRELQENRDIGGWTFTGSYGVGMQILKTAATGPYPRPAIIEMGGKNPTIVSNTADMDKAVTGVIRAAFGMDGQKCSACSRVYIQEACYETFKARLVETAEALTVGDPTARDSFMGTVINRSAYEDYQKYIALAKKDGKVLSGGNVLVSGDLAKGYYVAPAIIEGLPETHDLVVNELFLPILVIASVKSLDQAMEKANATQYGLTAGFFGEDQQEINWFFDQIQAGTTFSNRALGATTGAWPGVQAFGGWKGSGSSGKAIGSVYTLSLYLREQSRTIIGDAHMF